ncbi:MAG: 23S rRNA (pseudouridine(1915)-N(3))-methyltransferase RlmH [Schleiferiaceae bacterium]|nr:23S rRNA (pseudouridine(1915)-N(3))-methyltransferase RlmH [Schleiferiaceae bacterium]
MKIVFLVIGKTSERYLTEGMAQYEGRLKHYLPYETIVVPDVKGGGKRSSEALKELEYQSFQKQLQPGDWVVLLDEKGKGHTSRGFAQQLQKWMNGGPKRLVFIVGGAYGFSQGMYDKAQGMLSMSAMTTSHQLIRVVFLEQLYRAFTILNNEPYHND